MMPCCCSLYHGTRWIWLGAMPNEVSGPTDAKCHGMGTIGHRIFGEKFSKVSSKNDMVMEGWFTADVVYEYPGFKDGSHDGHLTVDRFGFPV